MNAEELVDALGYTVAGVEALAQSGTLAEVRAALQIYAVIVWPTEVTPQTFSKHWPMRRPCHL